MPLNQFIQSNVALQSFNTFGIAASARLYLAVTEIAQLQLLCQQPEFASLPRFVLGGGSNIILGDDFPGIVLHMVMKGRERIGEDDEFIYVRAAAGEVWHDFVQWTLDQGWGGLENLSLIPGSVGAAPIQNIGAYGVEMETCFHSLSWFEFATGELHTLTRSECKFAYRDSVFKHTLANKGAIVDVTFAFAKSWQAQLDYADVAQALRDVARPTAQQISDAICAIRRRKLPDPRSIGNAGSFFKNPLVSAQQHAKLLTDFPQLVSYPQPDGQYKLAAGWLIEKAGWKGRALGRTGVYQQQALVLVNLGGATGAEVRALAQQVQADVRQQFGVQLDIEPVLLSA